MSAEVVVDPTVPYRTVLRDPPFPSALSRLEPTPVPVGSRVKTQARDQHYQTKTRFHVLRGERLQSRRRRPHGRLENNSSIVAQLLWLSSMSDLRGRYRSAVSKEPMPNFFRPSSSPIQVQDRHDHLVPVPRTECVFILLVLGNRFAECFAAVPPYSSIIPMAVRSVSRSMNNRPAYGCAKPDRQRNKGPRGRSFLAARSQRVSRRASGSRLNSCPSGRSAAHIRPSAPR